MYHAALFQKKLHFPSKKSAIRKDFSSPDRLTLSNFLSFLSRNLFVKCFFSSENAHFSVKTTIFGEFFSKYVKNPYESTPKKMRQIKTPFVEKRVLNPNEYNVEVFFLWEQE